MLTEPLVYLEQKLAPLRQRQRDHDLGQRLHTLPELRRFLEAHVFAVWDSASLLKALQRHLTDTPVLAPSAQRFLSAMTAEEKLAVSTGGLRLYVRAMKECGADTGPIRAFLAALAAGQSVYQALDAGMVPTPARRFVEITLEVVNSGKYCAIAAAFAYGCDSVPVLLRRPVAELRAQFPDQLDTLAHYLAHRSQPGAEAYRIQPRQLVHELCSDEPQCWLGAQDVATRCIEAQLELWDSIETEQESEMLTVPIFGGQLR